MKHAGLNSKTFNKTCKKAGWYNSENVSITTKMKHVDVNSKA